MVLGGQKKESIEDLHSETLDKTLKKIKKKDSLVFKEQNSR